MKIKACRICGNKNLIQIGSLGNIAISDFTDTPQEGTKYPLTLMYCERCTLLQLLHNTPRDLLYKNYWYESHLNPIIEKDLKEIASLYKGKKDEVWISIGENDGTLHSYVNNDMIKVAVDPASNIKNNHSDVIIEDYWNYEAYNKIQNKMQNLRKNKISSTKQKK